MNCTRCNQRIPPGDDYFQDFDAVICTECLDRYILDQYDWYDIADELGFTRCTAPEEPAANETEKPIPGQLDMFGGEAP